MVSLQIFGVIIVQLVREKQAHIFVSPSQAAHIRRDLVQFILHGQIRLVVRIGGQALQCGYGGNQLVAVFPCDCDSLGYRQRGLVARMACHPFPGILALIESEFERAAAGDAAELARGELVVALELQPVNETVMAAVGVHGVQERLAIQTSETLRAKTLPKECVTFRQSLFRQ